jgi:uncharacterized membrane protein YozB (DUF420 family)
MTYFRSIWTLAAHHLPASTLTTAADFDFAGIEGFIPGSRASLTLDLIFVAMFVVLAIMVWSIWLVKVHRRYLVHKRVQLGLGTVLLAAILAFEIDMRISGWQHRAEASPYFGGEGSTGLVFYALYVHLFFAIPTAVLWVYVIAHALWAFDSPPQPGAHSARHRFWGRVAAWEMLFTSLTGWLFYLLAFVA